MTYELIKVSELPELTTPSDPNVVPIQDGDYLKRISFQNLKESLTGDIADDLEAETQAREQAIQDEAQAREDADDAILADLAAEYDATATYAVGDYCIHEGQLQRCIVPIETAEAWTASHWTAVALGDDVSDLKNALTSVKNQLYIEIDITSQLQRGYYINLSGGVGATVDIDNPTSNQGFAYIVIPCLIDDSVTITCLGGNASRAWAILDDAKKILSVAEATAAVSDLTLTATQDGYFVVNANLAFTFSVLHSYLGVNDAIENLSNKLDTDVQTLTNNAEIVIPRRFLGVIGIESNLYKENCLLYGNLKNVAMTKFMAFPNGRYENDKRYRMLPTETRNDNVQFGLFKYDLSKRDTVKNVNLIVTDPSVLSGLSKDILIIGDSKVAGGRLPKEFLTRCTSAGMNVGKLKGSVYSSNFDVYHEGRSGWASFDYMSASKGGVVNPFYSNGTFDFAYYMNQQGYTHMDYVFINLGTNDYANASGLSTTDFIQTFIDNINTMITSIHNYDSNIIIVIGLAEGVCTSEWSSSSATAVFELNTRASLLHKECISAWDTRANDNNKIYVCPIYLSMDYENDYNMETVPLSERDEYFSTGKTRYHVLDTMHQSNVGYGKNADLMFATLSYIESLNH